MTHVDWAAYGAVLFDLDGVITPTAEIHERAWSDLFAPWGFTSDDYLAHVDGRPRYEGVQAFLTSRQVQLPWGDPSDPPGTETVCALGNRKDEMFNAVLSRQGIAPYAGSMKVLAVLDELGVPMAIVSSSKNARQVLSSAGLVDRFDAIVDGVTAVDEQLPGKPDPGMFEYAARQLSSTNERCVVVEDAISGVAAGRAGKFGFVLGVDRGGNRAALIGAGADLVVDDLAETVEETLK